MNHGARTEGGLQGRSSGVVALIFLSGLDNPSIAMQLTFLGPGNSTTSGKPRSPETT